MVDASAQSAVRIKIETALFELLRQKPYKDISVSELAQRAGISRQGLYLHYKDKDSVLQALSLRLFSDIMAVVRRKNAVTVAQLVATYTEAVRLWSDDLRLFAENDLCGIIGTSFIAALVQLPNDLPGLKNLNGDDEREYIVTFWVSAFISVYTRWLVCGMDTPEDELNRILTDIMTGNYFI